VSLRVDYDERAISQAAEFLDDPQGIRAVLDAIDRLADDPRPAGSFPYGSPDLRRLRIGRYRVLYEITKRRSRSGTFPHRMSHIDLTGIPQRWLRDLTWDYIADLLRSPGCPRTASPLDGLRRAAAELGVFLDLEVSARRRS